MCASVAPDCSSFGYDYSQELVSGNHDYDKEPDYDTRPITELPGNEPYEYGPNRFFNERNESDNLWATASRDLTTARPYWQVPESYGFTAPYPIPTDAGKEY